MGARDSDSESSQELDQEYEPSDESSDEPSNDHSDSESEDEDDDDEEENESLVVSEDDIVDKEEDSDDDVLEADKAWDEMEKEAREADKLREDNSDSEERRMRAFNWWVPERKAEGNIPKNKPVVESENDKEEEDSGEEEVKSRAEFDSNNEEKRVQAFNRWVPDKKDPCRSLPKKPKLG